MSKDSSQSRRQTSTHYHDDARQHQEVAHLAKRVAPKEPRHARKTGKSASNRPRSTKP